MHGPAIAVIVIHREVEAEPVVPKNQHVLFPFQSASEGVLYHVPHEEAQQEIAFVLMHSLDCDRIAAGQVERFFTGFRMGAHHRMATAVVCLALRLIEFRLRTRAAAREDD
jgi:hypothetical protein